MDVSFMNKQMTIVKVSGHVVYVKHGNKVRKVNKKQYNHKLQL